MWWIEALKWLGVILAVMWGSFVIWRKTRPDYPEEEILSFMVWVAIGSGIGVLVSGWIGVWGMLFGGTLALWRQTKTKEWDFWEWADVVGGISLWLGAIIGGLVTLNLGYGLGMVVGAMVVSLLGRTYRRFKWYKSGKMGFIFLLSLIVLAGFEIVVETISPRTIYWVGLTVSQWIAVCTIVAATIAIYVRSGQTVAEQIWRKIRNR